MDLQSLIGKPVCLKDRDGAVFSGTAEGCAEGLRVGEKRFGPEDIAELSVLLSWEEAVQAITPGRWRHFKGNEYEVIAIARHSETQEPMVVYRALYGEGGVWVRPAWMWQSLVVRGGQAFVRFARC